MKEINICGYVIKDEWKSNNAGNSVWNCAFKNDKKYFIKQLMETYYDISYDEATPFQKDCIMFSQAFEKRITKLYSHLKQADNGNLIVPIEFLKYEGHYYIISEWVEQNSKFNQIRGFTNYQKHLMMKILAYNIYGLAENNIVHCDLKPDNILIKETVSGIKTLKIIDFDNGFIEGEYPDILGGDQNYMSPEAFIRTNQDEIDKEDKIPVTPKSDIFSLGIIFHEILTGELPEKDDSEKYIGLAVGHGKKVSLYSGLATEYCNLIEKMLYLEPAHRPDALSVFEILKNEIDPLDLHYRR